jgi:hypothetical protein
MKPALVGLLLACVLPSPVTLAQDPSPGCDLGFDGSARSSAKNRKPSDGAGYDVHGDINNPLSIAEWFTLTCSLDKKPGLPLKVKDTQATLPGIETTTVTVKGFVVAAKWDADNDLHVQLAPTAKFTKGQIIVEIPPLAEFCDARTQMWNLIHEDEKAGGNKVAKGKGRIMKKPFLVEVTGFVFFDGHHGDTKNGCSKAHISGIHGKFKTSPIKGLWEIHPAINLTVPS